LSISVPDVFDDEPGALNAKTACLYVVLVSANVLAWLWAFLQFHDQPILLGTASLAYTFGLRHAVDPDHIAAIDNVTRKLMQEGKRPISVGFFFALGHSTIVIIASLLVALSVGALEANFAWFKDIGSVIGTGISAAFLLAIALINALILIAVYRAFTALRRGELVTDAALHDLLSRRGFLARLLRSLFAVIFRSWHMYPLGLLFGLGFDTASEIALLALAAGAASTGLPFYAVLDATGKKLADSDAMPKNGNIGYPGSPEEITAFGKLLKDTAPHLSEEQRAKLVDYLRKNAPQ